MTELNPPHSQAEMDMSIFGPGHVQVYQQTKGETGYIWNGTTILLLTTKGRASGQMHTTPLIFFRDGDKVAIVASKGGAPQHPAWYLNLEADPHVKVQIKDDVYDAVARTAGDAEREQLWPLAAKAWPQYDDYQKKTDRKIPIVVLDRA